MSDQGYNGWKNYETWAVALWIDNDQGTYNWSRYLAEEVRDHRPQARARVGEDQERERDATGQLAENLKDWMEESMPDLEASLWSDLLSAAFSEVDWYEIAENYLSEQVEA